MMACEKCEEQNSSIEHKNNSDESVDLFRDTYVRYLEQQKIHCVKCNFKGRRLDQLKDHVKECHSIEADIIMLDFDNEFDFHFWKGEQEKKTMSLYVQNTSAKTIGANKHIYFYCNRSGYVRDIEGRKRRKRSKGDQKTNTYCTAYVKAIINKEGRVKAEFCPTHFGHEDSVEFLQYAPRNKAKLSRLLDEQDIPVNSSNADADCLVRVRLDFLDLLPEIAFLANKSSDVRLLTRCMDNMKTHVISLLTLDTEDDASLNKKSKTSSNDDGIESKRKRRKRK
ncbi:uncharacterized protein LOC117114075 isoform X2 [Anneissia japonica]|uniref:uncharacterized protein LOC117114075 isoform X2 n=1 Tax=Anneissia japonica TaxID=1529436 RepID=UPI00142574B3|nr:uncharacterized protein LOC117114075 isoform X2 [Anneissia japonica]